MKKIFALVLLVSSIISGFGQPGGNYNQKPQIFAQWINIGGYTTLHMPSPTVCVRCIVYNSDSNNYAFSNGSGWVYFGGSGTSTITWGQIKGTLSNQTDLMNALNARVRYSDTSAMLTPYLRAALGVKYTDTTGMLSPYARFSQVVKYSDTSAMLSGYVRFSMFNPSGIGLGNVLNSKQVVNKGGFDSAQVGLYGALPSASVGPTFYYASDSNFFLYNNRTAYVKVIGGSGGGGSTDSSIFATRYFTGQTYYRIDSFTVTAIIRALGYTPYNSTNPNGYISGNQIIHLSNATGSDVSFDTTGSTILTPRIVINSNVITYLKLQQNVAKSLIGNSLGSNANNRAIFPKSGIIWDADSLKVDSSLYTTLSNARLNYLPLIWSQNIQANGNQDTLFIKNGYFKFNDTINNQSFQIGPSNQLSSVRGGLSWTIPGISIISPGSTMFQLNLSRTGRASTIPLRVGTDTTMINSDSSAVTIYFFRNGIAQFPSHVIGITESLSDSSGDLASTKWVKQQRYGQGNGNDTALLNGLWTTVARASNSRTVNVDTAAAAAYLMRRKDSSLYTTLWRFLDSLSQTDTLFFTSPLFTFSGLNKDTIVVKNDSAAWNAKSWLGVLLSTTSPTDGQVYVYNANTNNWVPKTFTAVTNLGVNPSPTGVQITSSNGSATTIPLVNPTNAGVFPPGLYSSVTSYTHFRNVDWLGGYDTLAYGSPPPFDSVVFRAFRFFNNGGVIVDTSNRNQYSSAYGFKFDTSYAPFHTWVKGEITTDTTNKWVYRVFRSNDSVYACKGTTCTLAFMDSVSGGINTVSSFSATSLTNGASITGPNIQFGPADATNPGMIKASGSQTFNITPTFLNTLSISNGSSHTSFLSNTALGTTSADNLGLQLGGTQYLSFNQPTTKTSAEIDLYPSGISSANKDKYTITARKLSSIPFPTAYIRPDSATPFNFLLSPGKTNINGTVDGYTVLELANTYTDSDTSNFYTWKAGIDSAEAYLDAGIHGTATARNMQFRIGGVPWWTQTSSGATLATSSLNMTFSGGAGTNVLVTNTNNASSSSVAVGLSSTNNNATLFYLNPTHPGSGAFQPSTGGVSTSNNTNLALITSNLFPIIFAVNNSEDARFTTSGNLVIGTTADSSAYLGLAAANSTKASLYIRPTSVAPTTPKNGQIWYDSTSHSLFFRDNGVSKNLLGTFVNPMTAAYDIIYGGALGNPIRLPANATTIRQFLMTQGDGTNPNNLVYSALQSGDIPNNAANTSGTAANLSGTPGLPNGTTATTQSPLDSSSKIATTGYVNAAVNSGKYTPSFSNGINISSIGFISAGPSYIKVGNVVNLQIPISLSCIAGSSTNTSFSISLPISVITGSSGVPIGNISLTDQITGNTITGVVISGATTSVLTVQFKAPSTNTLNGSLNVQYLIN